MFILRAVWPEIATYPLVVCFGVVFSDVVFSASRFLTSDVKWLWGAVVVPLGLLGLSYTRIDDLLNPKGKRCVLLDWPDYRLFKDLAVAVAALYVLGEIVAATGFYLVAISKRPFGLILILAALLQVGFTFWTLLLANWKSREVLGE